MISKDGLPDPAFRGRKRTDKKGRERRVRGSRRAYREMKERKGKSKVKWGGSRPPQKKTYHYRTALTPLTYIDSPAAIARVNAADRRER